MNTLATRGRVLLRLIRFLLLLVGVGPTGNSRIPVMRKLPVEPVCRTLFGLHRRANQNDVSGHPARDEEGRFGRSSRSVASGKRWTCRAWGSAFAGPASRPGTYGQVAWSWPPDAEVKPVDGATSISPVMGARQPGPQGDREAAVKTSARGRPGRPAEPWYLPPAFFSAGGPRTSVEVRSSPRPLVSRGRCRQHDLGAICAAGLRRAVWKNRVVDVVRGRRYVALTMLITTVRWNGHATHSVSSRP